MLNSGAPLAVTLTTEQSLAICAALSFESFRDPKGESEVNSNPTDSKMGSCFSACSEAKKDNAFVSSKQQHELKRGPLDPVTGIRISPCVEEKKEDSPTAFESDDEEFFDSVEHHDDYDDNDINGVYSSPMSYFSTGISDSSSPGWPSSIMSSLRDGSKSNTGVHIYHSDPHGYTLGLSSPPSSPKRKEKEQAPPPPKVLPLRFLRAGKGDPVVGQERYESTLAWRKENRMDEILFEPSPHFELIKKHYPHYFHLRGKNNWPVYYESPPKTNLKALREGGVVLDDLLRHYAMVTEMLWQMIEPDDLARSIYIIDLEGIGITDFVGEVVDFVRQASAFCNQHFPERAGLIMVINVPSWFKIIWNVVKNFADPVTLEKVHILRGKDEIYERLCEKIPIENIPPEFGGTSVPLGEAPEEKMLWDLMRHNNELHENGVSSCGGFEGGCKFCSFVPVRSY